MNDLVINETPETPKIEFNSSLGKLLVEGRSIPENSNDFYEPIISWLNDYKDLSIETTTVDFKLEYFNTSTSKYLLEMLRLLKSIKTEEKEVIINWYYDEFDEEIEEIGHDFCNIIHFPINIIVIPSNN